MWRGYQAQAEACVDDGQFDWHQVVEGGGRSSVSRYWSTVNKRTTTG
jgi:hypothetical protein